MLWTGSAIDISVREASIQQTNRLDQDERVSAVRVALDTLWNVVSGEQTAIFIPAFLCDACFGTICQVLMVTRHEPSRVDAGQLYIVVRHGNDSFEVPTLMWEASFKCGERRWFAAPHQQQEPASESRKERSNANKNNSQYLLPSWSWQRRCRWVGAHPSEFYLPLLPQLSKTGVPASVRRLFAFLRDFECYRDFSIIDELHLPGHTHR